MITLVPFFLRRAEPPTGLSATALALDTTPTVNGLITQPDPAFMALAAGRHAGPTLLHAGSSGSYRPYPRRPVLGAACVPSLSTITQEPPSRPLSPLSSRWFCAAAEDHTPLHPLRRVAPGHLLDRPALPRDLHPLSSSVAEVPWPAAGLIAPQSLEIRHLCSPHTARYDARLSQSPGGGD